METPEKEELCTWQYGKIVELLESYLGYFCYVLGGILGNFDLKNGFGCKLASVVPKKLTKKINYFNLSLGMGFDYSKTPY